MKFLQQLILIFGIACSVILSLSFLGIEAFAQITVCSGDSVVLVLNGYKQGSTLWQQSSDRTTWSIAQGIAYNDSLVFTADYYTTYYYRAIVTDGTCSPFYSDTAPITFTACPTPVYCTYKSTCNGNITDARDNQKYTTVQIGTQCWMAQNLNTGKRIDGIQRQTPGLDNQDTSIEKYCYNDNVYNCTLLGGLYLWDEMMAYGSSQTDAPSIKGICPTGWHIPTDNEWKCLEMTLGMSQTGADSIGYRGTTEGGKLKDTSIFWNPPNTGANNKSGFTALPGGIVNIKNFPPVYSQFAFGGIQGSWWTATESDAANVWARFVRKENAQVYRLTTSSISSGDKVYSGLSVRCIKDF